MALNLEMTEESLLILQAERSDLRGKSLRVCFEYRK